MSLRRPYLMLLGATLVLRLFCPYRVGFVEGHSMEPTLHTSQWYLLDTHAYHRSPPARGDIVVARLGGAECVKRVYAVPGDRFWVVRYPTEGGTMVLGRSLPAVWRKFARLHPDLAHLQPITVPSGALYLLGDNPVLSLDSRDLGCARQSDVMGRVAWRPDGAIANGRRRMLRRSGPRLAEDPGRPAPTAEDL